MKFTKMHGCGNDYVYVNGFEERVDNPGDVARFVSDRRFGIGSDGLILIKSSEAADFKMEMYNADGSEGAMCGNGIRCVAKYVYDYGLTEKERISVETKSGIKYLDLTVEDGKVRMVKVDMGCPEFTPGRIPVVSDKEVVVDEEIEIGGQIYRMTCVSMGNPHAVVFVENPDAIDIEKIGPMFENNRIFPDRINTEFVQVTDRKNVNMRVWERGSGETLACGTGACAVAVACVVGELTEEEITVHLRGGDLLIHYDRQENRVYMTGSATVVFDGEIDL